MKLRKGDNVVVLTGADKGKKGNIARVVRKEGRVVVDGVNTRKKSTRPNSKQPHGGIIEFFAPVNASNVQIICPSCAKPTRISNKIIATGKVRICKKCNQAVDTTTKKK